MSDITNTDFLICKCGYEEEIHREVRLETKKCPACGRFGQWLPTHLIKKVRG